MSKNGNPDGFVLSRTAGEYERLCGQAESWSPFTQRVLAQAGLDTGITALDAGCGPGEVMRLMARRVGPSRSETGVNIDPEAGPDYRPMSSRLMARKWHFKQSTGIPCQMANTGSERNTQNSEHSRIKAPRQSTHERPLTG